MAQTGTNQEYLKSRNTESVKEVIYKYGPISRSEVAKMLRLTPPTITTNVANLIRQGLVRECAEDERTTEHTLGRKRVMVEFVPDACYAIGVVRNYLGVQICLVDLRGDTVCEQQYADSIDDYDAALDALAADIEDCLLYTSLSNLILRINYLSDRFCHLCNISSSERCFSVIWVLFF